MTKLLDNSTYHGDFDQSPSLHSGIWRNRNTPWPSTLRHALHAFFQPLFILPSSSRSGTGKLRLLTVVCALFVCLKWRHTCAHIWQHKAPTTFIRRDNARLIRGCWKPRNVPFNSVIAQWHCRLHHVHPAAMHTLHRHHSILHDLTRKSVLKRIFWCKKVNMHDAVSILCT